LVGCNTCENQISQTVVSPSGNLKAVVFSRNCGATTGFNRQVSVIPATAALPDDGGNALILDGSAPLQVQWRADSALYLTGHISARVFKQAKSVAGITISYRH
jgi:hypothetical protein